MVDWGWLVIAVLLSFGAGVAFVAWWVNRAMGGLMNSLEKDLAGNRKLIMRIVDCLGGSDPRTVVTCIRAEIKGFLDEPQNWGYYK